MQKVLLARPKAKHIAAEVNGKKTLRQQGKALNLEGNVNIRLAHVIFMIKRFISNQSHFFLNKPIFP